MIFIILFIGLILRLINLGQSLWLDEAITALTVQNNSLTELITKFSPGDFHPPLYYLFLKFWADVFGYSEVALRIPSVIFGVAAIWFVYLIGQKLFSKRTGLIAALFLAVNPLAVYYAQEARMYTLAMMLVAGSIWFLLDKKWLWFVIFCVASVYTDYLPWLMFLIYLPLSNNRKLFIVHCSLFIVAYLPWLPYLFTQLSTGLSLSAVIPAWSAVLGGFSLKALALTFVKFIFGRISFDNKIVYGLLAAISGAVYFSLLIRSRSKVLWSWLLFPLLAGLVISLEVPIFAYFRFLFVLPAFILLLAGGAKSRIGIIFVLVVSVASLIWFNANERFWREDWREAAKYMETTDSLAIMPSLAQSAPLAYYQLKTPLVDINQPIDLSKEKFVYLIRYVPEIFDPAGVAIKTVEAQGYKFKENKNFNGVVIWKYERT